MLPTKRRVSKPWSSVSPRHTKCEHFSIHIHKGNKNLTKNYIIKINGIFFSILQCNLIAWELTQSVEKNMFPQSFLLLAIYNSAALYVTRWLYIVRFLPIFERTPHGYQFRSHIYYNSLQLLLQH